MLKTEDNERLTRVGRAASHGRTAPALLASSAPVLRDS